MVYQANMFLPLADEVTEHLFSKQQLPKGMTHKKKKKTICQATSNGEPTKRCRQQSELSFLAEHHRSSFDNGGICCKPCHKLGVEQPKTQNAVNVVQLRSSFSILLVELYPIEHLSCSDMPEAMSRFSLYACFPRRHPQGYLWSSLFWGHNIFQVGR